MHKQEWFGASDEQEDVEPRVRRNNSFSAHMHRFLRKQTAFPSKKVMFPIKLFVQKFCFRKKRCLCVEKEDKFQKLFLQRCILVYKDLTRNLKYKMRTTFRQTPTSTRSRLTAMSVWSRLVLSVPRRTVCKTEQIFWWSWSNTFCLLIARLLSSIDAESLFLNCAQRSSSCVTCSFSSWNSFWDVALSLSSKLLFKDSSLWCKSSRSCKSSYTRLIEMSEKFLSTYTVYKIVLNW